MPRSHLLLASALILLPTGLLAAEPAKGSLEGRVTRLEQQMENQALVDLVMRLEQLQAEVQQLRGVVEEQRHTIEGMQRRQKDVYVDVDRRLTQVEKEAQKGSALAASTAAALAAANAANASVAAGTAPAPATTTPATPDASSVSPTSPSAPVATTSAAASNEERDAYQKSIELLRDLRYEQAVASLRTFLQKYPNGRYSASAQYWLGEANYSQRNFKEAIGDYRKLIDRYPGSNKLAEALLKIGFSQYELGSRSGASSTLSELLNTYPNGPEAEQARTLLDRIKAEGE